MLEHEEKNQDKAADQPVSNSQGQDRGQQPPQPVEEKDKAHSRKKDLLEKLLRVRADFANYQKRTARNLEEARQWTQAEIIRDILPAVDDFEQALETGKTVQDVPSLLRGFKLVHKHLLAMLAKYRVEQVPTEGQRFDPAIHEALLQRESEDHEPGTVIGELRKGYLMNGRTLRPARVMVSKSPTQTEEPGKTEQNQQEQATEPPDEQ